MNFYYSGGGWKCVDPERSIDLAGVMLSYFTDVGTKGKPNKRIKRFIRLKRKRKHDDRPSVS